MEILRHQGYNGESGREGGGGRRTKSRADWGEGYIKPRIDKHAPYRARSQKTAY